MRRPVNGWGIHNHPPIHVTPGCPDRPVNSYSVSMAVNPTNMSGPEFKGMDPSNPATYIRPWNPAPGMIGYLNFDGANMQQHTPTQVQRGSQARKRKLNVGILCVVCSVGCARAAGTIPRPWPPTGPRRGTPPSPAVPPPLRPLV